MLLDGNDPAAIVQAADALAAGGLVGFPTETVYGLGARADDDSAVARIFSAKGRPPDHPLIVHVATMDEAVAFAAEWPPIARRLAEALWPGPLTVIVPRIPALAAAAAGGQATIGLRCPDHPVAQGLLRASAARGVRGVAAPSANRFGRISPTQAAHVVDEFGADLLVLDGGPCDGGIESTIVDCSRGHPVLLRPGLLTRTQIEQLAGEPLRERDHASPRASGTLEAHYAPRAKLQLMSADRLSEALHALDHPAGQGERRVAVYSRTVLRPTEPGVIHRAMPAHAVGAAHELFSVLRELDDLGAHLIWVEEPPATPEWDGVRDRLQRAAAA